MHACMQIVYAIVFVKLNVEIETVSCFSFDIVGRMKCMKNFNIKEITVLTTSNVHSLFVSKQIILTKMYLYNVIGGEWQLNFFSSPILIH